MSEITKLDIAFEDSRGIILDIFEAEPKEHGALITFNKGAIRANHYHKKTTQYTFLVSGNLLMRTAKVDYEGKFIENIKEDVIKPYMLITHRPYEAHAFEASENATILAFACGLRGGKDYEKDVYRLINNMFENK
tara:strand:+ start:29 stop:433 length:405 start_codon:yes stop_codon:yes gene_type:complete